VSVWKLAVLSSLVCANLVCAGLLLSGSALSQDKKSRIPAGAKTPAGNPGQIENPANGGSSPPDERSARRAGSSELPWARLDAALRGDVGIARSIWTEYLEACRSRIEGVDSLSAELVEFTRADLVPDYKSALLEDTPARETALDCLEKARTPEAAEALLGYYQEQSKLPADERDATFGKLIRVLAVYQDDVRVSGVLIAAADDPENPSLAAIHALSQGGPPQERLEYFQSRLADPVTSAQPGDIVGLSCIYAIGRMAKRGDAAALSSLYAMARDHSVSNARRAAAFTSLRSSGNLGGLSQAEVQELESLR